MAELCLLVNHGCLGELILEGPLGEPPREQDEWLASTVMIKTRAMQSPSRRSRRNRSHGKCCDRQRGRSHHGSFLKETPFGGHDHIREKDGERHTGLGSEGVGSTKHRTARLDRVEPLKDHAEHGTGLHVRDQAGEKGLFLEIGVVCMVVCE